MAASLGLNVLEDVAGGAAKLEGGFGGDRFNVGRAANAIGSEGRSVLSGENNFHILRHDVRKCYARRRGNLDAFAQVTGGFNDACQIHDRADVFALERA